MRRVSLVNISGKRMELKLDALMNETPDIIALSLSIQRLRNTYVAPKHDTPLCP